MKKIIMSAFMLMAMLTANAQRPCPTDIKRNNGNSCISGGTGGQVELEFLIAPNPNLQIFLITSRQGTATIIPSSKVVRQRGGRWYIDWCFETDNIGPISVATTTIQFYIDSDGDGVKDSNEETYICNQAVLPIKFKSIKSRRLDKNTIQLTFEAEEDNTIKYYKVMVSGDNGKTYKEKMIVFPDGIQGSKTYTVNVKL